MKYLKIIVLVTLFSSISLFAQINKEDSSVQTIAYWDLGEKQEYFVTYKKEKVKDNDTILLNSSKYDVDIMVIDSTANSYTIEWHYKNHISDQKEPIYQGLDKITDGLKIRFKTDEMGEFLEVINLNEIQEYVKKMFGEVKKTYDNLTPTETEQMLNNLTKMFTSKETIETFVLRDIQVFHTFHGGHYILGEVIESQIEIENNFGGKPFLADVTLILDDIDFEEYSYVLKYYQSIDKQQLKEVMKSFFGKARENIRTGEEIDLDKVVDELNFDNMQHESYVGSVIHNSGWILYTLYTRTIFSENDTHIETLIIELK